MTSSEWDEIYRTYHDRVMGYIAARVQRREDAEDLCADVFEKALRAAPAFDAARSSPGTWLYAITRNTVIDYFRRTRSVEELPEDLSGGEPPEGDLLRAERLDSLAAALEQLPDELTDVVVLRYYDRLPLTRIAEKLGMSYGTVKLRHQKALALLRGKLRNF